MYETINYYLFFEKIRKSNYNNYFMINNIEIKEYLNILIAYNYYLLLFIEKHINLKKYDDYIYDNILRYKSIEKKDMDIYQLLSCDKYKYFYIRNTIHVERLTEEETTFLLENYNNKKNLDINIETFLSKSLKMIVKEFTELADDVNINYDDENSNNYLEKNLCLLIGIKYDNFFENPLEDYIMNNQQRITRLEIFKNLIELEFNDKIKNTLNVPIKLFIYNNIKG